MKTILYIFKLSGLEVFTEKERIKVFISIQEIELNKLQRESIKNLTFSFIILFFKI